MGEQVSVLNVSGKNYFWIIFFWIYLIFFHLDVLSIRLSQYSLILYKHLHTCFCIKFIEHMPESDSCHKISGLVSNLEII